MKGFTLVELIVICAILMLLAAVAIPAIFGFSQTSDFQQNVIGVMNILKLAQNKTIASEGASQWGVYFNTTVSPNQFIIFKGNDYSLRDPVFDQSYSLAKTVEFSQVDFNSQTQAVFNRITGLPENSGSVTLRRRDAPTDSKTVYLESSGLVSLAFSSATDDERLKDSRHIHFYYNRLIDQVVESIILTFETGVSQQIPIADNLEAGQLYWTGEIEVAGEPQVLKVHTHQLDSFGAEFCIHRDRRYNSKALDVDLSGDLSCCGAGPPNFPLPSLIRFQADSTTIQGISASVSEPLWQ